MMDFRIRLFQDNIVSLVNEFQDIPFEARRLVLESVAHLVERKADEAIVTQREEMEAKDAESILEDKLGELSE